MKILLTESYDQAPTDISHARSLKIEISKGNEIEIELFDRHGDGFIQIRCDGILRIRPCVSNVIEVRKD